MQNSLSIRRLSVDVGPARQSARLDDALVHLRDALVRQVAGRVLLGDLAVVQVVRRHPHVALVAVFDAEGEPDVRLVALRALERVRGRVSGLGAGDVEVLVVGRPGSADRPDFSGGLDQYSGPGRVESPSLRLELLYWLSEVLVFDLLHSAGLFCTLRASGAVFVVYVICALPARNRPPGSRRVHHRHPAPRHQPHRPRRRVRTRGDRLRLEQRVCGLLIVGHLMAVGAE